MFSISTFGVEPFGSAPDAPDPIAPGFENCLFLSSREIASATLVASSEISTLPVTGLQTLDPREVYRSASKIDQYIQITLASPVAADTLAVVGANFSQAAVWKLQGAVTVGSWTDLTTWQSVWPGGIKPIDPDQPLLVNLLRFANTQPFYYYRLLLADPSLETTSIDIGRLMLGQAFQPTCNIDLDPTLTPISADFQQRSAFNRLTTDARGSIARRLTMSMSAANYNDVKAGLLALSRYCGLAKDFIFCLNPAATTDFHLFTMQAVFESVSQFQAQPLWDSQDQVWKVPLTIVEP